MGAGMLRFAFIFKDNGKNYALNAQGRDNITATVSDKKLLCD